MAGRKFQKIICKYKYNDGWLISPRPKQKFGTDKILGKIGEFLEHENEPDYFISKLKAELKSMGVGNAQIEELVHRRQKYQNNKIDEIHRSNTGEQHEEMVTLFDDLQSSFDNNKEYKDQQKRKNLIVGFTATPSDHSLARFGEFSHFAENMPIWIPFDSYTMKEAIEDGYILNPIKGIVPVSAKMFFEIPENELKGFENDHGYGPVPDDPDSGTDEYGKKSAIKYKNDCKIIDFSYKNINVQNIKVAFEDFSNVVVSDFDPIGDETRFEIFYNKLIHNELHTRYFGLFNKYKTIGSDISVILEMENGFADFINSRPKDAKELKSKINTITLTKILILPMMWRSILTIRLELLHHLNLMGKAQKNQEAKAILLVAEEPDINLISLD
jgi:hypothetical protein